MDASDHKVPNVGFLLKFVCSHYQLPPNLSLLSKPSLSGTKEGIKKHGGREGVEGEGRKQKGAIPWHTGASVATRIVRKNLASDTLPRGGHAWRL